MNEHVLIGQIVNHIVEGKFETHIPYKKSDNKIPARMSDLIQLSMDKNVPPPLISSDALDKAMEISIKKYEEGELFLPELINRAECTSKSREILADHAGDSESLTKGKAVLATIDGKDYTNGQEIVGRILKGLGYRVINMGNHVSASDLVESVKEEIPDILWINTPSTPIPEICMASQSTARPKIKRIIKNISEEGYRKNITILAGGIDGYNATSQSADDLGVDYRCKDPFQTIAYLKKVAFSSN